MSPPAGARAAAKAAVTMQILGIVGLAIDGAYWTTAHGTAPTGHLVGAGVVALLLAALLARRDRPSEAFSVAAALANVAVILVVLWREAAVLAREPRAWVPFQPHKLSVLALALMAPAPAWVGAVSIAAFTLAAAAEYLVFPPEVRDHVAGGEPWASFAFGAFALGVLVHRLRLARMEREAMRVQAEAESLRRLARMGLAVRDLSNTPLQTLRFSTALLRRRHPEDAARLDQVDRALDRLEQLDRSLSRYEAKTEWRTGDESFDPVAVLEGPLVPAAPTDGRRPRYARAFSGEPGKSIPPAT